MKKVLSLQKASVSKEIQLKAASALSTGCKNSSNASWFLC
ncbi:class III lanthipeptide [Bacillus thuringiensis]|nr:MULTISPECIES: class III lanthipeptide [Bacillus cereus group]MCU5455873.1 class III lanthipeptide [Bacillus cereus]MCU5512834.1 class III lanthipeptide [Bacillus cereus]MCU5550262.1 class III lanthipeptide [Bacillus cereus]MCU5550263.1 class III lanthipeptide [Bacillus cereus]MCU5621702.1 class III lanthipeptide [Bacillus cereus]